MSYHGVQQQFIADNFKRWLFNIPTPDARREAMNALKAFERASWHPIAFEMAVNELAPGKFEFTPDAINHNGTISEIRKDVLAVLRRYVELVEANASLPVAEKNSFGTREAMDYVSLATTARGKSLGIYGVKKYIDQGVLAGQIIGKTRVFSKEELDRFVDFYLSMDTKTGPKPGSHRKQKV